MRISKIKKHILSACGNILILSVLIAAGLLIVSPLCLTVILSLTPSGKSFGIGAGFTVLENYKALVYSAEEPFGVYLLNSAGITVLVAVMRLLIISPAAYVLAKVDFFGRRFLNITTEAALLFTGAAMLAGQYVVIVKTGITDTYAALVLPLVPSVLSLFILRRFIEHIPDCVIEAARLDGAGAMCVYNAIIMPNVKPALATLIVLAAADARSIAGTPFVYSETMKPVFAVLEQADAAGTAAAVSVLLMIFPVIMCALFAAEVKTTMTYAGIKE